MSDKEKLVRLKEELISKIEDLSEGEFLDFIWNLRNLMSEYSSEEDTEEDLEFRKKIVIFCNKTLEK